MSCGMLLCHVATVIEFFPSLQLIESKFAAENGVDINYTAFVQCVDDEYTGQAMEQDKLEKK